MSGGLTVWGFVAVIVGVLAVVIAVAYYQGYEARRSEELRADQRARDALHKVLKWPLPNGTVEEYALPDWLAEEARAALGEITDEAKREERQLKRALEAIRRDAIRAVGREPVE